MWLDTYEWKTASFSWGATFRRPADHARGRTFANRIVTELSVSTTTNVSSKVNSVDSYCVESWDQRTRASRYQTGSRVGLVICESPPAPGLGSTLEENMRCRSRNRANPLATALRVGSSSSLESSSRRLSQRSPRLHVKEMDSVVGSTQGDRITPGDTRLRV